MKNKIIYLLLAFFYFQTNAQHIELDIFNNLNYESRKNNYKATLEQNIFKDLVFTDSYKNKVTFEKKYLDLKFPEVLNNENHKRQFFKHLICEYKKEANYTISYSIDIFNNEIIKDNRNNKIETGKDIFGNNTYEEVNNEVKTSIKTNLSGALEYISKNKKATLSKNFQNKWVYSDSSGNKFEFGNTTWNHLKNTYNSNENIFHFLIHQYL
ncbi:hypothetical protein QVZ41_05765 [Wenyingzhuangia sp. chi5]|uniref:Uncharacterized protein n=1 Tax=Wenyingzhuangia gilva TaxID=3057677 RepID=A0ABT8VQX9_9FLAO|nr:hypothetical protein [Wenyingzhuangia sp. chi5]MDO3694352.1 hypothetical protein [Wenyingzhuangia sp. chi5]